MDGNVFGQCRCCLSEGLHRDVMQEYSQNGAKEVYYNMFASCFNFHLSNNVGTTLICTSCIQDLRNACAFRAKVINTEQLLLTSCMSNGTVVTVTPLESTTNLEVKIEFLAQNVKQEILDSDDHILPDSYADEPEDPDEARVKAFMARFTPNDLPRLPTRRTLYVNCKEYATHLDYLRGKMIPADKVMESTKRPGLRSKKVCMTKKMAHVSNICTILMNSNATPFKGKSRDGFPCYYCWKMCEDLQTLRDHQSKEQSIERIKKRLKKYGVECLVIYIDVTDLKCNICDRSIDGLSALKDHLSKVHKKKLYGVDDRVIPFKLTGGNSYECQICKFNFETFGSIERHMNIHYRNYVCEKCGNGFVTETRMKVHVKTVHFSGEYACEVCGKVFPTRQKHKTHVDYVHKNLKKNKCPKCPERFSEYFKRQKHMVEVHGWAPLEYKCNVCDKAYDRRYHLNLHMKRSHLDVKEIQCQLCSYMCYTSKELQAHLVKHNGERMFECELCKKSYARKKTLTEHMRIHNNDRRFACSVCGQAFVQNCSLKGHMKTHHPECVN